VTRTGWILPALRDSLLRPLWTEKAGEVERSGCVTTWTVFPLVRRVGKSDNSLIAVDSQFYVHRITLDERPSMATPSHVLIKCSPGQPGFHTHPGHTCTDRSDASTCKAGGWEAHQCQPSPEDLVILLESDAPFSVIQCGPDQFRFYYPFELLASSWPAVGQVIRKEK
jgi:hypothetical protein